MRQDTSAVGGFFEDLPVLAFVLAGVLSVASTACWSAEELAGGDVLDDLSREAGRALKAAVGSLQPHPCFPTLESVRVANLSGISQVLGDEYGWMASVWSLHPEVRQILVSGQLGSDPMFARSAESLINAICDDGTIAILEVRVVVWQANV